jgi:phosphatidylinositol 3-kinase
MDNLMLCEDGALFHIDFGFILGRDPKPMPPKVRLTKEIVEAMGGADSESYKKFRRFCSEAFNYLREPHASNLILNLLLLMVDGGVAHLNSEQDVMFVAERFCPNMTTEEAAAHFQDVITASVNALMPRLMEGVHTMAQAMRA